MYQEKIFIGSWFPKTKNHLIEFFQFLRNDLHDPLLDGRILDERRRSFNPTNVILKEDEKINYLEAKSGDITIKYFEDGLLVLSKPLDLNNINEIEVFYGEKIVPCLSYLFGKGAKGLELIREPGLPKKIYIYQ